MHSFLIHLLLAALSGFASAPVHTESQMRTILQKVFGHQDQLNRQLERFGYTEIARQEEDGKPKSLEVYEVSMYKARMIRRLVSRNGRALDGSGLNKENERVEKQIRNMERGNIPPLTNRRVKLEDLLHCSRFTDVQETTLAGRYIWSADFHPNPEVKPANVNERFAHNLDGKIGVDPASLQIVSFEFILRDAFKIGGGLWFAMKPGTHYLDQEEWLFSKIWLPKVQEFDMNAKAMMGVKLLIQEIRTYTNYKEFNVTSQDSVSAPK